MASRQIAPSTSVWFLNGKERIAAQVETRVGGAYQISLPGNNVRIVRRNQLVIRRPGSRSC